MYVTFKRKLWRIIIYLIIICLLIALTVGIKVKISEDNLTAIQSILTQNAYSKVNLVQIDSKFVLKGFVSKYKNLLHLEDYIQGLEQAVEIEVLVIEQIKEDVENVLQHANAPWFVVNYKNSLKIVGYAQKQEVAQEILKEVQEKLKIIKAKQKIITWETLHNSLDAELKKAQLYSKVRFLPDSLKIGVITFDLNAKEQVFFEEILLKVQNLFEITLPFIKIPTAQKSAEESEKTSKTLFDPCQFFSWNQATNVEKLGIEIDGKMYYQDQTLPQGWLIQELNPKYVVLTLDNKMHVCNAKISN